MENIEERVVDHIALDTAPEVVDPLQQPALRSPFKARYGNFIGGAFVDPIEGRWFDNVSPITGGKICEIARSSAADIEKALDAAHAAKDGWGRTSAAERALIGGRSARTIPSSSSPRCALGPSVAASIAIEQATCRSSSPDRHRFAMIRFAPEASYCSTTLEREVDAIDRPTVKRHFGANAKDRSRKMCGRPN
jgi:hypothetical protein